MRTKYFVCLFLSCAALAMASSDNRIPNTMPAEFADFDLKQDRMHVSSDTVYIVSSFDSSDHVTAYDYYGARLWDAKFHAKIISWQVRDNYIFIFSKARSGFKTYLSCVSRHTGHIIWEK